MYEFLAGCGFSPPICAESLLKVFCARREPPFNATTPIDTYRLIVAGNYDFPAGFDEEAKSVISNFLVNSTSQRDLVFALAQLAACRLRTQRRDSGVWDRVLPT